MKTKVIAYYLPQYHEIEENNAWWGKGFTEWTHVKDAVKLFAKHNQPRIPLDNRYYNLMEKNTVEWQTELSQKYGVYGFAYYHYWFKGRKILEKPAENLLRWKDINQKFFFFWANHTWYRAKDGKKDILIEQEYGEKEDWVAHYNYLRDFFKDERYIKVNNAPVIGIYIPNDVPDLQEMIKCWREMANKDGFSGIYIIESINNYEDFCDIKSAFGEAMVIRQPNISHNIYWGTGANLVEKVHRRVARSYYLKHLLKYNYKRIAKIEADTVCNEKRVYNGISVGWDNTPRHGKRGQVTVNMNKELFKKTFNRLYADSCQKEDEFIFVNAWNEWAEGMYLEPDEDNTYCYLEAIKETIESQHD